MSLKVIFFNEYIYINTYFLCSTSMRTILVGRVKKKLVFKFFVRVNFFNNFC